MDFSGLRNSQMQYQLEDDPMCGITTGGKAECEWDCEVAFGESLIGIVFTKFTNPQCLKDCFPTSHCVNMLLDDISSDGKCTFKTENNLKEIEKCIADVPHHLQHCQSACIRSLSICKLGMVLFSRK